VNVLTSWKLPFVLLHIPHKEDGLNPEKEKRNTMGKENTPISTKHTERVSVGEEGQQV